jgi:hypothetical protein
MGIVTMVAEVGFPYPPEKVYDFVTNPANWVKTYPGSEHEEGLPQDKALKVGDAWVETGPNDAKYLWQVGIAVRPKLWTCNTVGNLGHKEGENGIGTPGQIRMQYRFKPYGENFTVFERTYLTESYPGTDLLDIFLTSMNPKHAETYFAGIGRELAKG